MTDNQTNKNKLTDEAKTSLRENLISSLDLISLQADVAQARARLAKSKLEELIYTVELEKFKSPKKDGEN